MKTNYSVKIANTITSFLDGENWHYCFDEDEGVYTFGVGTAFDFDHVDVYVCAYNDCFTVSTVIPIIVRNDATKRKEMCEFICRANYGIKCGGFQYDVRNGRILYKVHVSCHGITPTREMVNHALCVSASMVEKYSHGILAVLYGGATAEAAVNACEKSAVDVSGLLPAFETAFDSDGPEIDEIIESLAEYLSTGGSV